MIEKGKGTIRIKKREGKVFEIRKRGRKIKRMNEKMVY